MNATEAKLKLMTMLNIFKPLPLPIQIKIEGTEIAQYFFLKA